MEMFVEFSPSEIGRTEEQGSPEVHEHLVKCLVGPREANCKVVIEYDQAPNGGPLSKIEVKYEHFPTVWRNLIEQEEGLPIVEEVRWPTGYKIFTKGIYSTANVSFTDLYDEYGSQWHLQIGNELSVHRSID